MFDTVPFEIPRGLNFSTYSRLLHPRHVFYMVTVYLPLALIVFFTLLSILKDLIKTKIIYNNAPLFILLVFLIFLFPLTQTKSSLRYFYTSFIFLYFFIGYGLFTLVTKLKLGKRFSKSGSGKRTAFVVSILLILIVPYWYYNNSNFVLLNGKYSVVPNTADFVESSIGKDQGLMVQTGYNYQLQYLTGRRIVGIPPTRDKLENLIGYYDISYIIFGKFILDYYYYSEDSIGYIKENPEKFELVATIKEEEKPEFNFRADQLYVYKVVKQEGSKEIAVS